MIGIRQLETTLRQYRRPYLTDAELTVLLDGSRDSRYGKVKRMIAQGSLLHIRRGLYCLTEKMGYRAKPHPYELAQYIYGPSYISLESAFSFYGLIPENVYTITSVTRNRPKTFHTPLGDFQFFHLPSASLYAGVELIREGDRTFLMAKPWKAICDYVYCYKKDWNSLEPFITSLRFDLTNLPKLQQEERELLNDYYQSVRINRFLKNIVC